MIYNRKKNIDDYTTVLLATFSTVEFLEKSIKRIFNVYELENEKIFLFNDLDNSDKKILTYNIKISHGERADVSKVYHTICVNRKQESNTLYTINSLNKIVYSEIGRVDNKHKIDWNKYKNMFITSDRDTDEIVFIKTELDKILTKRKFYEDYSKKFDAPNLKIINSFEEEIEEYDENRQPENLSNEGRKIWVSR